MAKYRPIDLRLWNDRKFLSLTQDGRMLWLFLLTAPCTLPIPGVIVAGEAALAEQLGWTTERLRERLRELFQRELAISTEGRVVWLRNALKYQPPANPNMIKGWAKTWDDVPECALKIEIWEALRIACKTWSKLFEKGFREPSRNGYPNGSGNGCPNGYTQEQEQEQEQKQEEEERKPPPATSSGIRRNQDERRGKHARDALNYAALKQQELKAAGIDPTAPNIRINPAGGDFAWNLLLDRTQELLNSDPDAVADTHRRRIDVAFAEAIRDSSARWFTPAALWDPKSFAIGSAMSPEQAAQPRRTAAGGRHLQAVVATERGGVNPYKTLGDD
jgi:hypothetical protein